MAVAYAANNTFCQTQATDTSGSLSYASGSANKIASSFTSESNRVAIFWATWRSSTVGATPAVTYNGVSATLILAPATNGGSSVALWGLKAPATGSQTFALTWTAGDTLISSGGVCFNGADQTKGWQNIASDSGTGTSASSTVTSANGNYAFAVHSNDNATSTTTSTGTEVFLETGFDGNHAAGRSASSSGSTVIAWTLGSSVAWINGKVDIIAAGGGSATTDDPMLWMREMLDRVRKIGSGWKRGDGRLIVPAYPAICKV